MRNIAFLAVGAAALLLQSNLYRALDVMTPAVAALLWVVAVGLDARHLVSDRGPTAGRARIFANFRPDFSLPAAVVLGHCMLVSMAHVQGARPIPALVLPLILFMGVHEYSLARGAAVAFVLGYATDVLGIAPVGIYTFTYVATFVLARAAGVRLAAQTLWMQVLLVGAFTLLQSTMVLVLLAIFGHDAWVPRSLYPLALPHAVATASVAPIVFRIAQAIHSATATTGAETAAGGQR
ncbi:MAG: rod shape-determining protein MreD [Polyangiaceae bacterium]|jgi:rod shape-determining protein MreD